MFCGMVMARINTMIENGHPSSEIVNESVIEAVNPRTRVCMPAVLEA
jgi:ketol-acid reductoisomerase